MNNVDAINAQANFMLMLRRNQLGIHKHGWWRGKPNPYTVGNNFVRFEDY